MYYSHAFYRILQRAKYVSVLDDVVEVQAVEGDEISRVPYSEMSAEEARAVLHYIGARIRRLKEVLADL